MSVLELRLLYKKIFSPIIASLAILGFYFPPESGEKVTLEITILMALTFYMNMVASMMPQSSQTPLIGIYFSCIMIMVANSVAVSILILSYHHRASEAAGDMPRVIRLLFLQWLPWALRISRPGKKITRNSVRMENMVRDLLFASCCCCKRCCCYYCSCCCCCCCCYNDNDISSLLFLPWSNTKKVYKFFPDARP